MTNAPSFGQISSYRNRSLPSRANYFWILFSLIGGIAGNLLVRDRDPDMARRILIGGLLMSIASTLLLWIIIAAATSSIGS